MARAPTRDPLGAYRAKRDFRKTREPAPGTERLAWGQGNGFMVQKHDASRLHFDFRLELDGSLKSWAVPKGPSLDPADRRLAVRTEDHPLGYATFEGVIPAGEYGGGTVMLWDLGTWTPAPGKDPRRTLEDGHLHFTLEGERMKGEWILIRTRQGARKGQESWILKKVTDAQADPATSLVDRFLTSVRTGRTILEIAAGRAAKDLPAWKKGLGAKSSRTRAVTRRSTALPRWREPQKATLVDHVPAGSGWIHEMKYDGYRCQLAIAGEQSRVFTRSGLDWTDRFPEIAEAARELAGSALLDGEIVSLDEAGRTSFSNLQTAIKKGGRGLSLFLFDALEIDGENLAPMPTLERKARLAFLLGPGRPPFLLYAEHILAKGEPLLEAMCKAGQEGIISKKADAPYRSGRTKSWLKIKCTNRQEFVILGWAGSDRPGRAFRSLLLGLNERGTLRYAGKVGTGFGREVQADLADRLGKLRTSKPAAPVPRGDARGAHWVEPSLVAEIAFAEFTADGIVRHASFIGLRGDKPAGEVVAETAKAVPLETSPIAISNPDRLVFPEAGITKGELASYMHALAPAMLPWVARRPLTLVRCPAGRGRHCFYQKHDSGTFGEHLKRIPIRAKDGKKEDYLFVEDAAGLVSLVQMGVIEIHGWGSPVKAVEQPDRLVFDIDPDEGLGFEAVRKAALDLRRQLADVGLQTFAMLTGGKGLHVIAPLKRCARWPEVKDFARRFALALATAEPERFTANLSKAARKGRMFLDYLRNQRGSTAVMPYSPRARDRGPVAAPIHWDEIGDFESGGHFTVRDAEELIGRAASAELRNWGLADQALPKL